MSRRAALLVLASAPAVAHASGAGLGVLVIVVMLPALVAGAVYGALCGAIRLSHKVAIPSALALFLVWLTFMVLGSANYTMPMFVQELIKTWITMTVAAGVPFVPAYYIAYAWMAGRKAPAGREEQ